MTDSESVPIQYADGKNGRIKKTSLERIDISRATIVIFGEGNFTFSVALAAHRGSWNGIETTKYEEENAPDMNKVIVNNIRYCISNGRRFKVADSTIFNNVRKLCNIDPPDQTSWNYRNGVDATTTDITVEKKVVWFQCPWISYMDGWETNELVKSFIDHMGNRQNTGDYLLIGITTKFPYVKNYELQCLLGENLVANEYGLYKFLGGDKLLIEQLLQLGYYHQGESDIHKEILRAHLTLVFQKK